MRQIVSLTIFTILCLTASGQKKEKLTLNWGLMSFGDTILTDETEILVGEWLDFVFYNTPTDYPSYIKMKKLTEQEQQKLLNQKIDPTLLPDLNVIGHIPGSYVFKDCSTRQLISFSSVASQVQLPLNSDSLNNSDSKERLIKYLKTPVTGITYEQALKFCRWRTTTDSLRFFPVPKGTNIINGSLVSVSYLPDEESYIFSLPTPSQFDALNPNQDSIVNKKGLIANFNYKDALYSNKKRKSAKTKECGRTIMIRGSFFSSSKSVISSTLDMQGNASEMTSIKGIAKGGSYFHSAKDSMRGTINNYSKPEPWLGFRCVAHRRQK